jgi:hypothetical protein
MSTLGCPRPLHPFPRLVAPSDLAPPREARAHLSQAQRRVVERLGPGSLVLFDIKAKRALVLNARQGLRQLAELTVRMLSDLVRLGWLRVMGREGRLVHYALAPSTP